MATVYGNPAQGYALEPGKKVDPYGYVEGSQHYMAPTEAMKAANPNPNPGGGGFIGGSSTPVNVTAEGVSVGGAKPVPQTPNIAQAPGYTDSNSNVALTAPQQATTDAYNAQAQQQNQDIQTRARQAFEKIKSQPITQDSTGQQVARTALGQPPKPSVADNLVQTDPYFADIQKMAQDFFSPAQQRQSLTQEYQNLLAASGIQGLDTELLNMKTVLEGTEDDIRNEVVKAGGFATESQVMALTNARNKQLIKNYNNLLETRNAKEQYLDKMMSLSAQDRQEANQRFDSMMNIGFKMAEYGQRMQQNAQEAMQKVVDAVGYDGLYQQALMSGDKTAMNRMESTLGLPPGGLLPLSIVQTKKRAQEEEKTALDLELKRQQIATEGAQRANIYAGIKEKEQKIIAEGNKAKQRIDNSVNKAEIVLGKIQQALPLVSGFSTGLAGQQFSKIGGTDAYNLQATVDTIKANLGFDTLQEMRESSPTGGALGQVAVQELNMLQSTVASLDIGQDEKFLKQGFKDIQKHYEGWLSTLGYSVAPDGKVIEITE